VLAGEAAPRSAAEVDGLLARAETLFARRGAPEVREASRTWLSAAASDASRTEGLVGAARAGVWLADHETDSGDREDAATRAVDAAHLCLRAAPGSAACAYWLAAALGVQARERPSTGLSALPRIVEEFTRAAQADPSYDEAGPDRALALVYVRAPGWPTGPGDPDKGLQHARKAVALRGDYPPNRMALAEALRATDDVDASRAAWEEARATARVLAGGGDPDAPEWIRDCDAAIGSLPERR
jgi:hypothetical protein